MRTRMVEISWRMSTACCAAARLSESAGMMGCGAMRCGAVRAASVCGVRFVGGWWLLDEPPDDTCEKGSPRIYTFPLTSAVDHLCMNFVSQGHIYIACNDIKRNRHPQLVMLSAIFIFAKV